MAKTVKQNNIEQQIAELVARVRTNDVGYLDAVKSGLVEPNTTQFPNELLDFWMPFLRSTEFVVLCYLVRKTYGYGKGAAGDAIPLSQITNGTVKKDGTYQDYGTRLNKSTVTRALAKLEKLGLVERTKARDDKGGDMPTHYRLVRTPIPHDPEEALKLMSKAL